jgi:hypothetical protein
METIAIQTYPVIPSYQEEDLKSLCHDNGWVCKNLQLGIASAITSSI